MKTLSKALLIVLLITPFSMAANAQQELWEQLSSKVVKLYQQGRYAEAAKVAEEALTVAEKTFGLNHPIWRNFIEPRASMLRQSLFISAH
jgi:hypothetical protein